MNLGLASLVFVVAAVLVGLLLVLGYSIRLQRRAVASQSSVVEDHFSEKEQRKRSIALSEEALELQRRALKDNDELLSLLRKSVELQQETLRELRAAKG
jgi:predicted Holliday junction resolvase-like endonuclease